MNIQRTEDASEDIRLQSIWYDVNAGQDVSTRYLNTLVETIQVLARQPNLGRARKFRDWRLARLRSICIQRPFDKHPIFYRVENDTLVVFRVLHGVRDLPRRLVEPPGAD